MKLTEQELMDRGTDHAYARILSAAYEDGYRRALAVARQFYPEVLEGCAGMALADMDHAREKNQNQWPYRIIFEVCDQLREERNEQKGL